MSLFSIAACQKAALWRSEAGSGMRSMVASSCISFVTPQCVELWTLLKCFCSSSRWLLFLNGTIKCTFRGYTESQSRCYCSGSGLVTRWALRLLVLYTLASCPEPAFPVKMFVNMSCLPLPWTFPGWPSAPGRPTPYFQWIHLCEALEEPGPHTVSGTKLNKIC